MYHEDKTTEELYTEYSSYQREEYFKARGLQADGKTRLGAKAEKGGPIGYTLFTLYILFLIVKDGGFIFTEVRVDHPVFFYLNPIWLIFVAPILFFIAAKGHKNIAMNCVKTIYLFLFLISLPFFASICYYYAYSIFDGFYGIRFRMEFTEVVTNLYYLSFGNNEIVDQLNFWSLTNTLVNDYEEHSFLLKFIRIVTVLILLPVFIYGSHYISIMISNFSDKNVHMERGLFGSFIKTLLFLGLTFFTMDAYLNFATKDLPSFVGTILIWSIMLFPFFGLNIALNNRHYFRKARICNLLFLFFVVGYIVLFYFYSSDTYLFSRLGAALSQKGDKWQLIKNNLRPNEIALSFHLILFLPIFYSWGSKNRV